MMRRTTQRALAVLLSLLALDALWLGWLAAPAYRQSLGHLMAPEPRWWAALLFYLTYTLGLLVFVVPDGCGTTPWKAVARRGALYGLVAYATFELTALAVLDQWPLGLPWLDMGWGALLSAVAALAGWSVDRG